MRISTNTIYAQSTNQLGTLQSQLARTQQQLATNKRMLSAADDPIASARAVEVSQSKSINAQFATNRANARSSLSQEEVALTGVQSLIQDVQGIAVAAANGSNSPSDRATYANELQGRLDDLVALANSSDGNGGYVFSGYASTTQPFVKSSNGVDYMGDQGQVQLQVASSRKVGLNDPGSAVFNGIPTGNGSFTTAPVNGNAGSGVISGGMVTDPSQLTGHSYNLEFTVAGTNTSYTITDQTTNPPTQVVAGAPYKPGAPINVAGMQFDVSGIPADSDEFTVKPSDRQSLFTTLGKMIDTLRGPAVTDSDKKAMTDGMSAAINNLSLGLDNVLAVRSSVGARMKELDTLDTIGSDADIQYAATLSGLQDLDLVQAISQFTQQQATLEAAQKTFKSVSSLSLFNFIG